MLARHAIHAICVSLVAAAAGACFAGPLDRSCVGPHATWVVHVDVDAALASSLGAMLRDLPDSPLPEISAKMRDELGMDPLTDLHGVTLYGEGLGKSNVGAGVEADGKNVTVKAGSTGRPENAVAILTTTEAATDLHVRLRAQGRADEGETTDGVTVFSMQHEGETLFISVRPGKRATERLVIFAPSRGQALAAADVLSGGTSLKDVAPPAPLDASPGEGAVLFVAAARLDGAMKTPPKAAVFKNTRALRFEAGERVEAGVRVLYAEADLGVESPQTAVQLEQIVRGAMAMGMMATQKQPEHEFVAALVNGVTLKSDGAVLKIAATHDAAKAVAALKQLAEDEKKREGTPEEDDDDE